MKPIHELTLRTCHDIRHWTKCARCQGIGDNREMIRVKGSGIFHRICFKRQFGLNAVRKLTAAARGQFTLADLGVAGMRKLLEL